MNLWKLSKTCMTFACIVLVTACGGGGGSNTPAVAAAAVSGSALGTLVDAPVCGVNYVTSGGYAGITDSQGQFNYSPGETVKFTAAGVLLGSASPTRAPDGTSVITPVNLVPGATGASDPKASSIAVFLSSLNTVSTGISKGQNGIFIVPDDASLTARLQQIGTTISDFTSGQIQSVLDQIYGTNKYKVTSTTDAQAGLNQGINSQGIIGTVWNGPCTCGGGGTFYFQPGGTLTGYTSEGQLLSGSWAGSSVAAGGVQLSLLSSGGGYSKNGVIASGSTTGTADIFSSSGTLQGTVTFTKVTTSAILSNSLYFGGWYATLAPNAAAIAAGNTGGAAYFIVAPNGTFSGITDGKGGAFNGTWTVADGTGTATFTNPDGTFTINFNLASKTGTVTKNGQALGTLALSRSGSLTKISSPTAAPPIPLLLNVTASWANTPTSVSSLALSMTIRDSSGLIIANGVKSLSTPLNTSGVRSTTTDNISVSYPAGAGKTYELSIGPSNCTGNLSSAAVVDSSSGNASAYPTVSLVCN